MSADVSILWCYITAEFLFKRAQYLVPRYAEKLHERHAQLCGMVWYGMVWYCISQPRSDNLMIYYNNFTIKQQPLSTCSKFLWVMVWFQEAVYDAHALVLDHMASASFKACGQRVSIWCVWQRINPSQSWCTSKCTKHQCNYQALKLRSIISYEEIMAVWHKIIMILNTNQFLVDRLVGIVSFALWVSQWVSELSEPENIKFK